MQKIKQEQTQKQRLTTQQIQLVYMLQDSTAQLEEKIAQALMDNPALEVVQKKGEEDENVVAGMHQKDRTSFVHKHRNRSAGDMLMNKPSLNTLTPREELLQQFRFLQMGDHKNRIAEHIVGSLTDQGYLSVPLNFLVEEMAIDHGLETDVGEVEEVVKHLKEIAPVGALEEGLQQCLYAQLQRGEPGAVRTRAIEVVKHHFQSFMHKNYEKIAEKLRIGLSELEPVVEAITRLTPIPMPGSMEREVNLEPDFEVKVYKGRVEVVMMEKRMPSLRVSKRYQDMLKSYKKEDTPRGEEAITFIQEKINQAKWFMQALKCRRATLLKIMKALVTLQKDFFITGDLTSLRPIFLRNVADVISMDISTVSRAISRKSVQTHGCVYPLKFFFSEPIPTTDGKVISSRIVKQTLQEIIEKENKQKPYLDADLANLLKEQGYILARRTVAKYREGLGIPIAKLRREIFKLP